jgi:group I intron endonuclease
MEENELCQTKTTVNQLKISEKLTVLVPNDSIKNIKNEFENKILNDTTKISGIYKIVNKVNGKYYVGSSKCIKHRWRNHKYQLRKNIHKSKKLQSSWNKHGESNFNFIVIEECLPIRESLVILEQKYLNVCELDRSICYNTSFVAEVPFFGRKHTLETRKLISEAVNLRYKEGMMRWNKGKHLTDEHKKRVSETRIRLKIKPSEKQRRLQSEMVKGKNNYFYGKSLIGSLNSRYISDILQFYNKFTKEIYVGTRYDFITKFGLPSGNVCRMIHGGLKSVKGWSIHNSELK